MTTKPCLRTRLRAVGLRAVEIAPVELQNRRWLCLGFEEAGTDRGDYMHLAFLNAEFLEIGEGTDLYEAALSAYRDEPGVCVRIHSECLLGDAMGSTLCDCRDQLMASYRLMSEAPRSVLIYLRQEGRGIGMRAKLGALSRQHGIVDGRKCAQALSPDDANLAMGFEVDEREYSAAAAVLKALDIGSARLITGNLEKVRHIEEEGIAIDEVVDVWSTEMSPTALRELREKAARNYRYARLDDRTLKAAVG